MKPSQIYALLAQPYKKFHLGWVGIKLYSNQPTNDGLHHDFCFRKTHLKVSRHDSGHTGPYEADNSLETLAKTKTIIGYGIGVIGTEYTAFLWSAC